MRRALALFLLLDSWLAAQRFYSDDPLMKEPEPLRVENARRRKVDDFYDFFANTLGHPGEHQTPTHKVRAQGVNTLGEVPDGAWYENRHYARPGTLKDLTHGPGGENAPDLDGPLTIIADKSQGITPGFVVQDRRGRIYFVKFDPPANPEMATSADVIGSKFFHALGYHVPDNYIVFFKRSQLVVKSGLRFRDRSGEERDLSEMDISETLLGARRDKEGRFRAVASLRLPGEDVGKFRYHGTRSDDPNDVVPHEHRRDLRGLFVFSAWLGHDDSRAINTLDTLVSDGKLRYIKHHLIDFGSILGSASTMSNSARSGNEHLFAIKPAALEFFTLGMYVPKWARIRYPHLPSVGRFEWTHFDPERYKTEYPNMAFTNRLPDDTFWAARQVMAFTDEEIRAIVRTGEYSDPAAEKWIADALIARRDKIGRTYFARVLPLDRFRVSRNRLEFDDLAAQYNFAPRQTYTVRWSRFNNSLATKTPIAGASGPELPPQMRQTRAGDYFAAEIGRSDSAKTVTVYLRSGRSVEIVGIERTW
jgi:hypothetical protein